MNKKIGNIATYIAGLLMLGLGVIYLTKSSFMPYHSDAVGVKWENVDNGMQVLILALMRAVAAGNLACAFTTFYLQKKFSTNNQKWIPLLILIQGLILGLGTIYATFIVKFNSPGQPPITLLVAGMIILFIGYIFNRKSINQ